jgi:hypothetical protein
MRPATTCKNPEQIRKETKQTKRICSSWKQQTLNGNEREQGRTARTRKDSVAICWRQNARARKRRTGRAGPRGNPPHERTRGLQSEKQAGTRPDRRVTKNKRQKNTHARNQALGRGPKAEQQNHEAGGSSS